MRMSNDISCVSSLSSSIAYPTISDVLYINLLLINYKFLINKNSYLRLAEFSIVVGESEIVSTLLILVLGASNSPLLSSF